MAKQGMGKSMGNRECDWVRARLPLWVHHAVRDEQSQVGSEGSDLSAKDSSVIAAALGCMHLVSPASSEFGTGFRCSLRWPRLTYRLHKTPRRSGRSLSAGLPILKHPTVDATDM